MKLKYFIQSDLGRYVQTYELRGQAYSKWKVLFESFLFKAGFQAVFLYRVSHWFFQHGWTYLAWLAARINLTLTGAEIEFNAKIGPGLFIAHPVGIVIGRGVVIGSQATLFQGATLAVKNWHPGEIARFPKVGNSCFIFAHAVILGGISVGDYCVVAANAVVTKDLPEGSLARGVPAEIYPNEGKSAILSWLGQEQKTEVKN